MRISHKLSSLAFALISSMLCHEALALSKADLLNGQTPQGVTMFEADKNFLIMGSNKNHVIKWKDFNVEKEQFVSFNNGNFLNIVKGKNPSIIDGSISGLTSKVYIVNPNGITIGRNAIIDVDHFGLSTAKMTDQMVQDFTNNGVLLPSNNYNINKQNKGMGKIKLLGTVRTHNLLLDGSQIIIKDFSNITIPNQPDTILSNRTTPGSVTIKSSTNRIDIGGSNNNQTNFDIATDYSLTAKDGAISHIGQTAIGTKDELLAIKNNPNGEYWLYDDVKVDDLGGNLGEFTGKLDGAFNTITYKFGNVEGGETGLFSKLNQATVENLKIKDSEINATTLTSDLKVGALASRIENSTLKNVEVKNFKLSVQNEGASKVQVGSLAGEIKGDNSFHNVNAVNLEVEGASNAVKGSLVGSVESGNHKVTGLSFGSSENLKAQGAGDEIFASSLEEGLKQAADNAQDTSEIMIFEDGDATHQGFMLPYFVEDFEDEYDGKPHDYQNKVNNEYFDINNHVDFDNKQNGEMIDANEYHFDLASDDKRFYFVKDGKNTAYGDGIYNITKKDLGTIKIEDLTITEGEEPSFSIANEDSLNFAEGDSLADLNLNFKVSGDYSVAGSYEITAESTNGNYTFTIDKGDLTVNKKNPPVTPPVDPVDPPVDPVDPPVDPVVPPVDPVDPPVDPVVPPVDPVDPPVDPVVPPVDPVDPPVDPVDPPVDPVDPPVNPVVPVDPVKPNPGQGGNNGNSSNLNPNPPITVTPIEDGSLKVEMSASDAAIAPCDFCKGPDALLNGNDSAKYQAPKKYKLFFIHENLNELVVNATNEPSEEEKDKESQTIASNENAKQGSKA